MTSKTSRIIGWILTGLVGLFMIGASGIPKFIDWPGKAEMMDHLGISLALLPTLGVLEIAVTVLYLIPRTSFLGAILLTGYLGGAIATHVRIGDPFIGPIILGVMIWLGLYLRDARLRALIPWKSGSKM